MNSMNNIFESVGAQDHSNDDYYTKLTRQHILQYSCLVDHPACLRAAYVQLLDYLENPTMFGNRFVNIK